MFDKILIANRGEIALRIERACKELGIARWPSIRPRTPTRCMCGWPTKACALARRRRRESYLNIPGMLFGLRDHRCRRVHPGVGFLSENARFAEMVEEHGVTFIGPSPEHMRIMGDKVTPRRRPRSLACRSCLASLGAVTTSEEASHRRASAIPVLIKAAAGGGGRGMKVARNGGGLASALSTARAEAKAAFGDDPSTSKGIFEPPAPHRNTGDRRWHGRRGASGRARLLDTAPPPEDHGGDAVARTQRGERSRSAIPWPRPCRICIPWRRHGRVPV